MTTLLCSHCGRPLGDGPIEPPLWSLDNSAGYHSACFRACILDDKDELERIKNEGEEERKDVKEA